MSRNAKTYITQLEIPAYGYIVRKDEERIRCPYCGKETFTGKAKIFDKNVFVCPKCKTRSAESKDIRHVIIERKGKKISVRVRTGIGEITGMKWFNKDVVVPAEDLLELYETVVFNLENGHLYLEITGGSGTSYCQFDITEVEHYFYYSEPVVRIIDTNKTVYRRLVREFASVWKQKLPFKPDWYSFDRFRLMTMFVGYDRCFYDGIPYEKNGYIVVKDFRKKTERIHFSKRLPYMLEISGMPGNKTVRRLMFTRPWLFFYLKEMTAVWFIAGDVNQFNKIFEGDSYMDLLIGIYRYPGIAGVYESLRKIWEPELFYKLLLEEPLVLNDYAIRLLTLNVRDRNVEIKKAGRLSVDMLDTYRYNTSGYFIYETGSWISTSVCCYRPYRHVFIPDTTIDDYSFNRLRNYAEYIIAGKQLKNCLENGYVGCNDIYVISKKHKYIAACEATEGRRVVCVRGMKNNISSLTKDSNFMRAFEKWKTKYKLFIDGCFKEE